MRNKTYFTCTKILGGNKKNHNVCIKINFWLVIGWSKLNSIVILSEKVNCVVILKENILCEFINKTRMELPTWYLDHFIVYLYLYLEWILSNNFFYLKKYLTLNVFVIECNKYIFLWPYEIQVHSIKKS